MRDFITCLEFLTRIRFSHRTDWRDEDFSRSVPYFPLVGLVIGAFLGAVNYALVMVAAPDFMRAALLILAEIIITGGLMYDGFMDTSDGVFSARSRERMLEIMKDSHVGSNAVLAVIVLILLKVSAYLAIYPQLLTPALIAMSVATRTFMVIFIVNFPYARKTGIGHMFTMYAKKKLHGYRAGAWHWHNGAVRRTLPAGNGSYFCTCVWHCQIFAKPAGRADGRHLRRADGVRQRAVPAYADNWRTLFGAWLLYLPQHI